MGHETTEITERYYSRFTKEDVKRIVTRTTKKGIISEMDARTQKEFREFQTFLRWREKFNQ